MKALTIASLAALLCAAGCSSNPSVRTPTSRPPVRTTATMPPRTTATVSTTRSVTTRIVLSSDQIAAVRAHFAAPSRGNGRGNGRGRNGGLPPGIAMNLERGKALPPGIARQTLPSSLIATLPRLDSGLSYVVAAGKLLLIDAATDIVRDVLIDALFS